MEEESNISLSLSSGAREHPESGNPPGASPEVRIRWALVDEKLVSIHNIPQGAAGHCRCVACGHKLVPRRGPKASWHFGHEKGAPRCPLHGTEALKRFQAKMLLKDALAPLGSLRIIVGCRSNRRSHVRQLPIAHDWMAGWDEVRVDFGSDGTTPDLLLLRHGSPIAAIEVRGSTPVGARKQEALRGLGVPWTEAAVDAVLDWAPADALPVCRLEPEGWLCPMCVAERQTSKSRAPQAEDHEARLAELRDRGRLRLLWVKEYNATFEDLSWQLELHICDLVDELGLPLHRLLVNGDYDFVVADITADELASSIDEARKRFEGGKRDWIESLTAVGIKVVEAAAGWRTVAEARYLYDSDAARRRLREQLRRRVHEPEVVAACCALGVALTDDIRELRSARNKLAKVWHPDVAPVGAVEAFTGKMQEINAAFDLLCAFQSHSSTSRTGGP